jgi:hydrogenase expression/formation protein HypE
MAGQGERCIQLAHGGGGALSQRLVRHWLVPALGGQGGALHDAATLEAPGRRLAVSTDSYVVHPLEFAGGDIGRLAVLGSLNDLAMAGARPLALSLGLILEEGLPLATLEQRSGPWPWRDWRVVPAAEGRWRLEREASGSEQREGGGDG